MILTSCGWEFESNCFSTCIALVEYASDKSTSKFRSFKSVIQISLDVSKIDGRWFGRFV